VDLCKAAARQEGDMGRKRGRGFEWIAEGQPGEIVERVERRNRSEMKRDRERLTDLAARMIALSPGQRKRLPLDDETLAALEAAVATRHGSDQRRKLRYTAAMLADQDPAALEAAIAALGG
jgi:ribosomal 50S subunit-associated protein YjgA (DUF615 family)